MAGRPSDLGDQFVLSRIPVAPDGWDVDTLGAWQLATHPSLEVIGVVDHVGDRVGWMLGYPISADGELVSSRTCISVDRRADPPTWIDGYGGRFLAILPGADAPSIYPDAVGAYASVYSPELEMAASTPGLIPYSDGTGDRLDLVHALGFPHRNGMYPVGLTPRQGVHRLLPNHYVELDTWEMRRQRTASKSRVELDVEAVAERIVPIARRQVGAIVASHLTHLPLTAGQDSRMLLACSRDVSSQISTYTVELPDLRSRTDIWVASRIARDLGLAHTAVPMLKPTHEDLLNYLYRTTLCFGEVRGWNAWTTKQSFGRDGVHLSSHMGELARGQYWTDTDTAETPISPERLAAYCGTQHPVAIGQLDRWIQEAPTDNALDLLDLFYIEQRLGCWGSLISHAEYYGPGFWVGPMDHREIMSLMMSLPERDRREGTLPKEIMRQQWPELLDWPFNTTPRLLRIVDFPRRATRGTRRRMTAALHRS